MIRTFVAVFPPPEVTQALREAAQALPASKDFRLIGQEKIHLTLKFLGDVAEEELDKLGQTLRPIRVGHYPFEISTSNFGAFPSERRPRILWVGVEEGAEHLRAMAEEIETLLEPVGFERENRPYLPHLTLGRARSHRPNLDISNASPPKLRFTVSSIELVESAPSKNGVTYSTLETYAF